MDPPAGGCSTTCSPEACWSNPLRSLRRAPCSQTANWHSARTGQDHPPWQVSKWPQTHPQAAWLSASYHIPPSAFGPKYFPSAGDSFLRDDQGDQPRIAGSRHSWGKGAGQQSLSPLPPLPPAPHHTHTSKAPESANFPTGPCGM